MINEEFTFLKDRVLVDGDLELVLIEKRPEKPEKGYFPCYIFEMRNINTREKLGMINIRIGNNDNTKYGGHIV